MPKFKTYRGKRFRGLKITLGVLLIAGLVGLGGFVIPNYVEYDQNGNLTLVLPFFREQIKPTPTPAPPSPSVLDIVLVTDPPAPGKETPAVSDTPTDNPTNAPQNALQFAVLPLTATAADIETAKQSGADAILLVYKSAEQTDKNLVDPVKAKAFVALCNQAGLPAVAVISVALDNAAPRTGNTGLAVKASDQSTNYLDAKRDRWLNLYKPETLSFLGNILKGAETAGFDRLLLENIAFPASTTATYPGHDDRKPEAVVADACTALKAAVSIPVDAVVLPETCTGDTSRGQNLKFFQDTFETVYMKDGDGFVPAVEIAPSANPSANPKNSAQPAASAQPQTSTQPVASATAAPSPRPTTATPTVKPVVPPSAPTTNAVPTPKPVSVTQKPLVTPKPAVASRKIATR